MVYQEGQKYKNSKSVKKYYELKEQPKLFLDSAVINFCANIKGCSYTKSISL